MESGIFITVLATDSFSDFMSCVKAVLIVSSSKNPQ
jgi:hypothetical protein